MIARRWVRVLSLTLACPAALAQSRPATRVDWPTFLARHDLVWDRLPTRWGESAFIGNGRLGATIDARDSALGWTINRTDVVHDVGAVDRPSEGAVSRIDRRAEPPVADERALAPPGREAVPYQVLAREERGPVDGA